MNIRKKILIAICFFMLGMLVFASTSFALTGTITTEGVRIRAGSNTESEVLTHSTENKKVEVLTKDADWYKIKYDGIEGYIHGDYLQVDEETPASTSQSPAEGTKNTSKIYVHIIPVIYASVIEELADGQEINVIKTINNWSLINYGGKEGWIPKVNLDRLTVLEEEVPAIPEEDEDASEVETEEPSTPANKIGYTNTKANLRSEPSLEAEVLTSFEMNIEVTILEEGEEWTKVTVNGQTGYIASRLISSEKQEVTSRGNVQRAGEVTPLTYYVSVNSANVRKEPTTSSEKLGTLSKKAAVEVTGEENGFYQISYKGSVAYISKDLLVVSLTEIQATVPPQADVVYNSNGTAIGADIVAYAKQFLGYSYVYAGTTPSGGFDCSGFTYYIFTSSGYPISRSCSGQNATGTFVAKSDLALGDLVVFNDSANQSIGHVGIYIGGGEFIHAANPQRGVVIDTLNSGYYYERYIGARRIV